MKRFIAVAIAAASFVSVGEVQAQIVNGSLTGLITNGGVPTGWRLVNGSPDTMDQNNNVGGPFGGFAATPSPSPDGGTWVGIGSDIGFIETFAQLITGLTVGQTYNLSWFSANFGYAPAGYIQPNAISVLFNGSSVASGATTAVGTAWTGESYSFTATSSSLDLGFQLATSNKSYMSIDGIALSQQSVVPEPSTYALVLMGTVVVGVTARRRRRTA